MKPLRKRLAMVVAALALPVLAGCDEQGAAFFGELGGDGPPPRRNTALSTAQLAQGAVPLVPPDGFCIDKRGLRQDFALLARCDSLGGKRGDVDAPLGFIAVSVTRLTAPFSGSSVVALPGPDTATLATQQEGPATILHLKGPTPSGTDPQHWKGLLPLSGHVVAFTAYGPPGGRMARKEGGAVLAELAQRIAAASARPDAAPVGSSTRAGSFD